MILIQSSITGFSGKPSTVLFGYDEETNVLMAHSMAELKRARIDKCFIITNMEAIDNDLLFTPAMLKEAIHAYFFLTNSLSADDSTARFILSKKAVRCDPSNSIEKDGFDENGDKYRMNDDITNAQIAVLAACYYVSRYVIATDDAQRMIDELSNIDIVEKPFNPFAIITV